MEECSAMRVGLVTLDSSGAIALFNRAAEQILGYRAAEVRGRPCEEIFTGLTDRLSGHARKHPDNGAEIQLESTARHKNGHVIHLMVTPHVAPNPDNGSACNGGILLFQMIQQLGKTDNPLQHLNRLQSLDHFAAGIVHEIRNPLAGISINAQHIVEEIETHCHKVCTKASRSEHFREEMQDILADVQSIENIVKKVLDFAHPNKSQVREFLVEELVDDVLKFSKMLLRRQGIRLRISPERSLAKVRADVSQIKQVFLNIVRNACDAMPEGGELRVRSAPLSEGGRYVCLEVADTGPGIAKEHLERIFDPFVSMHGEGTGLGLAISRKIVEDHGGRIDVKSTPGKGTTFGVVLPTV